MDRFAPEKPHASSVSSLSFLSPNRRIIAEQCLKRSIALFGRKSLFAFDSAMLFGPVESIRVEPELFAAFGGAQLLSHDFM